MPLTTVPNQIIATPGLECPSWRTKNFKSSVITIQLRWFTATLAELEPTIFGSSLCHKVFPLSLFLDEKHYLCGLIMALGCIFPEFFLTRTVTENSTAWWPWGVAPQFQVGFMSVSVSGQFQFQFGFMSVSGQLSQFQVSFRSVQDRLVSGRSFLDE